MVVSKEIIFHDIISRNFEYIIFAPRRVYPTPSWCKLISVDYYTYQNFDKIIDGEMEL